MGKSGNHYVLNFDTALALSAQHDDDDGSTATLWHARLAHFNVHRIRAAMISRNIHSAHASPTKISCAACSSNQRRSPHKKQKPQSRTYTFFGERVVSDTCGPFPPSPAGLRFAIIFVDMFSRLAAVYFLKSKSAPDVLLAAQTYVGDHKYLLTKTSVRPGSCRTMAH